MRMDLGGMCMPGYQSKFLGSWCGFFGQFFDVFEFQGLKESGRLRQNSQVRLSNVGFTQCHKPTTWGILGSGDEPLATHVWGYWGCCIIAGWWFGTFFIFPDIGNVIIPTDFHSIIFQRGSRSTTNQIQHVLTCSILTNSLLSNLIYIYNLPHDLKPPRVFCPSCDLCEPRTAGWIWKFPPNAGKMTLCWPWHMRPEECWSGSTLW